MPANRLTPAERRLVGEIGAHESWERTENRSARTQPGRDAMLAKFDHQVDPDGTLTPAERATRAEHARKAYFKRLALKSAQARRRRGTPPAATDRPQTVVDISTTQEADSGGEV